MEIKIKKIGRRDGTCGWLAAGIQSGEIRITEGVMRDGGHHALFAKWGPGSSQLLAAHNQYGLEIDRYSRADQYEVVDDSNRDPIFTPAAWASVMQIAGDWCELCNTERDNDGPLPKIRIVRIGG